jgi:hypothetical protein
MELPSGIKTAKDLYGFYEALEDQPAYKDLKKFLEGRREKAIKTIKQIDDPVARATWILVDEILTRKEFVEEEAKRQLKKE